MLTPGTPPHPLARVLFERQIRLTDLADEVGVTPSYLSNVVHRRANPSRLFRRAVAAALGEHEDLLFGDDVLVP